MNGFKFWHLWPGLRPIPLSSGPENARKIEGKKLHLWTWFRLIPLSSSREKWRKHEKSLREKNEKKITSLIMNQTHLVKKKVAKMKKKWRKKLQILSLLRLTPLSSSLPLLRPTRGTAATGIFSPFSPFFFSFSHFVSSPSFSHSPTSLLLQREGGGGNADSASQTFYVYTIPHVLLVLIKSINFYSKPIKIFKHKRLSKPDFLCTHHLAHVLLVLIKIINANQNIQA